MPTVTDVRSFTKKQQGDACEMLVAAELTLAGVPAAKMPDNWPDYDVSAQLAAQPLQRISVKSLTFSNGSSQFVDYDSECHFDWLAAVFLPSAVSLRRRIFVVPRSVADTRAPKRKTKNPTDIYWSHRAFVETFPEFEDNFRLLEDGQLQMQEPV